MSSDEKWDAFISHASEDKQELARPLAEQLISYDLKVWYDEFTLNIGDSLSESIDYGLSKSHYGIVILSKKFFEKGWPRQELRALITKQVNANKRIILPIWHNISKEEIEIHSPILADTVAAKSNEGIPNIARKLYRQISGIKILKNFNSDTNLSETISPRLKSIKEREIIIKEIENETTYIILTKIYLVSKGYHNIYIYLWPFLESLSSNKEEQEKLKKYFEVLSIKKFIESKGLGTISITHTGIKEIERLIENSKNDFSKLYEIVNSIPRNEIDSIHEIQKLRYIILRTAYDVSYHNKKILNIFKIGQPLGIEKEKLERIFFYLEHEGLIYFSALGGNFYITYKGKEVIEKNSFNRIF
jgi:hypothetical protein